MGKSGSPIFIDIATSFVGWIPIGIQFRARRYKLKQTTGHSYFSCFI